jgi:hypothetical protein
MKPIIDTKGMETIPAAEGPSYIVTASAEGDQPSKKSGVTKRHVLYAVSAVLVIAIILVAILVGVYMFTQSQKEILKFSLQYKGRNHEDINEEVESDPNDNVVQYHVTKEGQDSYIVNDFNRGIQVLKITEDGESDCFATALNRSAVEDPAVITRTGNATIGNSTYYYTSLDDAVVDRSFLTKKARDICKDVPLTWIVKRCDKQYEADAKGERVKRCSTEVRCVCSKDGCSCTGKGNCG